MEDRHRTTMGRSWKRLLAISAFIALACPTSASSPEPEAASTFTLRHILHRGTYRDPALHKRLDIHPSNNDFMTAFEDETPEPVAAPRLSVRSKPLHIERLVDRRHSRIQEHLDYAGITGSPRVLDVQDWTVDELLGPNVTDKETIINLALMAANAYVPKNAEGEWEDVGEKYNHSTPFGWEGDGIRGHIFADDKNKTIIVGLKGTSPAVFDGDGTTTRDKLNDNLFFGCCCGQGGQFFWRQVCDCQTGTYSCNSTCLVKSLKDKTRYYSAAIDLYTNITEMYPNSNVWVVGHSLGGAVSSLLGLTFGLPVVTYEAPGDDLPAKRLGLPHPRDVDPANPYRRAFSGAHHIGHTADPIFMGACNTATSPCTLGGYSMESQCHTGTQCVYDTVGDKGWRLGLGYHRIHDVINNVIRKYDTVPECVPDKECQDCFNWKFFESNGSDSKTSTTMTKTSTSKHTRTETCETPGWWGCLDRTTTTSFSTPVITTTYTTTTCLTPGWFGCNEEANTTITTTTAVPKTTLPSASATTSMSISTAPSSSTVVTSTVTDCEEWGWFGCRDPTTRTHTHTRTHDHTYTSRTSPSPTSSPPQTTCETPGIFFGCYDETTTSPDHHRTHHHSITQTVTSPPSFPSSVTSTPTPTKKPQRRKCKHAIFFGLICVDPGDGGEPDDGVMGSVNGEGDGGEWQSEL